MSHSINIMIFMICDWSLTGLIGTLDFLMIVLVSIFDCPSKYFWRRTDGFD